MAGRSQKYRTPSDIPVFQQNPPQEVFLRRFVPGRLLTIALFNLLTVILLSVSFAPIDWWPAAYVALVPWAVAVIGAARSRWVVLCAYLAGVVFWALNLYWMWWITLVGYTALVFYLSLYWLAGGVVVRFLGRIKLPMWIVLPVVWVAMDAVRERLISGFPWFFLAHSQWSRTMLIQIADVTGQHGVTFFVAMVNGVLVDILTGPLFVRNQAGRGAIAIRMVIGLPAAGVACAAMLIYGSWRINQQTRQDGPVIGIVQQAYPISLSGRTADSGEIFQTHLKACERFAGSQCDLVLWPETMIPTAVNSQILNLDIEKLKNDDLRALVERFAGPQAWDAEFSQQTLRSFLHDCIYGTAGSDGVSLMDYADQLARLSQRLGCPLLVGGSSLHYNPNPAYPSDRWTVRNSALWFEGGRQATNMYSKVKLVPFGEYVPFKRSWLGLHKFLVWFVPSVMNQLDAGLQDTLFELHRPVGRWGIVTPICYEGVFAERCRDLVTTDDRKADIIANMSNDGWFVYQPRNGTPRGSSEHAQHLVQYCFRAIETRSAVVRAVNTGISASIDSNGRIVAQLKDPPGKAGRRVMVSGTLLLDGKCDDKGRCLPGHGPKILVDRRVSIYSLIGDSFAAVVFMAAAAMLVVGLVRSGSDNGRKVEQ